MEDIGEGAGLSVLGRGELHLQKDRELEADEGGLTVSVMEASKGPQDLHLPGRGAPGSFATPTRL